MSPFNLRAEAERCRAQAASFQGAERKLLLRIALLFERMAAAEKRRDSVEETRCW